MKDVICYATKFKKLYNRKIVERCSNNKTLLIKQSWVKSRGEVMYWKAIEREGEDDR